VDGTLFVVRNRFSRAGPVREALELLFQRQAKVLPGFQPGRRFGPLLLLLQTRGYHLSGKSA